MGIPATGKGSDRGMAGGAKRPAPQPTKRAKYGPSVARAQRASKPR